MNNVIKRVSAFVMAFTLLGTGTVITKNILPESDTTIVADAAIDESKENVDIYPHPGNKDSFYPVMYSPKIKWIQRAINYLTSWGLVEDGWYGSNTRNAVMYFQWMVNDAMAKCGRHPFDDLVVDGYYGPKTHHAVCFMLKYAANYGLQFY